MSNGLVLKVCGGVLVLLAGAMVGRHIGSTLSRRLALLEELCAAFQRLSTELTYQANTLASSFRTTAQDSATDCAMLLTRVATNLEKGDGRSVAEVWSQSVSDWGESAGLRANQVKSLQLLGPALGRSGRDEQKAHLEATIARLEVHVAEARQERNRLEAFYNQVGLLVAAALVLLLI